jgi:hypothetical protein
MQIIKKDPVPGAKIIDMIKDLRKNIRNYNLL